MISEQQAKANTHRKPRKQDLQMAPKKGQGIDPSSAEPPHGLLMLRSPKPSDNSEGPAFQLTPTLDIPKPKNLGC